jgi:hypothetical protein
MKSFMKHLSRASHIYSSVYSFNGSKLDLNEDWNIIVSYGRIPILFLKTSSFNLEISVPSIKIYPDYSSNSLISDMITELFPAPVLPIIPIFSPGLIFIEMFFKTSAFLS